MNELRDGEIMEDEFSVRGLRTQRCFMLLEGEMNMLASFWTPWWVRKLIVSRVKADTRFDDGDNA